MLTFYRFNLDNSEQMQRHYTIIMYVCVIHNLKEHNYDVYFTKKIFNLPAK